MSREAAAKRDTAALVEMAKKDPSVLAVLLFGSRARGEEEETSDVDVSLVLDSAVRDPLQLSEVKHRYVSRLDLDVHVFQQLPLHMQHRVLRDARVLYVRDEELLYRVASHTAQRYEDFRHLHDAYLAEVAHG